MTGQKPIKEDRGVTLADTPGIDNQLYDTLDRVHREKVTCSSDFARTHAGVIGMAASLNLITTQIAPGLFQNEWQITAKGLRWHNERQHADLCTD